MKKSEPEKAIATLPEAIREPKRDIVQDESFHGYLTAAQANELAGKLGSTVPELMVTLLPFAAFYALTPVSNFPVGAVSQGKDTGNLYYGANMEFSGEALSFSVHGEQAATNHAWLNGETGISRLAISAAPCGYCRQFLYEMKDADDLQILLPGMDSKPLVDYLPDPFGPGALNIKDRLMLPQDNGVTSISGTGDEVAEAALKAANVCYAPYTKTYSGVAIKLQNGKIFSGRYAENAAYNPSFSPLESALSFATLYGENIYAISECALVTAPGPADQANVTRAVLSSVAPNISLAVYAAT